MTKSMPPAARTSRRGSGPGRLGLPGALAALLVVLLLSGACGKKETAGAGGTAAAGAPGSSPAAEPAAPAAAPGPSIRETAEAGRPAWDGLKTPSDIALDDKGRLWVADQGNSVIRVYDAAGAPLGGWGGRGSGPFGLQEMCGLAIKGDDLYVADTYHTGVEIFSLAGQFKAKSSAGLFNPHDAAPAPDGKVWIADSGNNRLVVSDADLSNPRPVGRSGAGPGEFANPGSLVVGSSGRVYVADIDNKRVQVLDAEGNPKAQWKFAGWGPNGDGYLDLDSDETLLASDTNGNAIVQLDKNGREAHRWTTDDAGEKFSCPRGIALDRRNRILYVVNSGKNSVTKLKVSEKK
jgi:DNA-binding beta-propeller fold protein YncE